MADQDRSSLKKSQAQKFAGRRAKSFNSSRSLKEQDVNKSQHFVMKKAPAQNKKSKTRVKKMDRSKQFASSKSAGKQNSAVTSSGRRLRSFRFMTEENTIPSSRNFGSNSASSRKFGSSNSRSSRKVRRGPVKANDKSKSARPKSIFDSFRSRKIQADDAQSRASGSTWEAISPGLSFGNAKDKKKRRSSAKAILMAAMHLTRNERKKQKIKKPTKVPENFDKALNLLKHNKPSVPKLDEESEPFGRRLSDEINPIILQQLDTISKLNPKVIEQMNTQLSSLPLPKRLNRGSVKRNDSTDLRNSAGSKLNRTSAGSKKSAKTMAKLKKGTVAYVESKKKVKPSVFYSDSSGRKLSEESNGSDLFANLFKVDEDEEESVSDNDFDDNMVETEYVNPKTVYDLKEILGTGAFGEVRKCVDKSSGLVHAVKICTLATYENLFELSEEVDLLQQLVDCPYTVRFIDSIQTPFRELWITMELCEGGDVSTLMELCDITLEERHIVPIIAASLLGLKFLHEQNIVHRDIKGANILLSFSGVAKLSDFGVSRNFDPNGLRRMSMVGSPYWMAPETIKEQPYGSNVDIWALGVTAIELFEGNPPLIDLTQAEALEEIKKGTSMQGLSDPGNASFELDNFISRCLTRDSSIRPSATELLEDGFIKDAVDDLKYLEGKDLFSIEKSMTINSRNLAHVEDKEAKEAFDRTVHHVQTLIDESMDKIQEDRKKHVKVTKAWARRKH